MEYFIFIDESGDLECSPDNSKYLIVSSLALTSTSHLDQDFIRLRREILASGLDIEYFHATSDKQVVRDAVFDILAKDFGQRVDALIIDKTKTNPSLRSPERLLETAYRLHLNYVVRALGPSEGDSLIIITDRHEPKAKVKAIDKGIKLSVAGAVRGRCVYHLYHHNSRTHAGLQGVDYYCWALSRKWERGDLRSYALVSQLYRSEFDVFRRGTTKYYRHKNDPPT